MDTLYIVMPAYNEGRNIDTVVESWISVLELASKDSKLVVADSGSTDDTHERLLQLKDRYPNLEILPDTGRQHGPKLIALYRYAIEKKADFVFQTDSDGQTNPDEFQEFWELRKQYDAVIGNRTVRGDGRIRKFVENVVCLLLRIIFGIKVRDANAPFRLMKCSLLSKYMERFDAEYNLPNIMLVVFFVYYKERFCFHEISFQKRKKGTGSLNIWKITKIGWNAIGDFYQFKEKL